MPEIARCAVLWARLLPEKLTVVYLVKKIQYLVELHACSLPFSQQLATTDSHIHSSYSEYILVLNTAVS